MPLNSLLDNQFEFCIQTHQPISDIENLPYQKFEAFIERLNKRNDELKEKQKKENEEIKKMQNQNSTPKTNFNPSSIANKMRSKF